MQPAIMNQLQKGCESVKPTPNPQPTGYEVRTRYELVAAALIQHV